MQRHPAGPPGEEAAQPAEQEKHGGQQGRQQEPLSLQPRANAQPRSVRAQDGPEQQRRDRSQGEGEGKRVSSGHVEESGGQAEVIAETRSIDEAPGEGQRQQDPGDGRAAAQETEPDLMVVADR